MFDLSLSKEQKMVKDSFAKVVKDLVAENAHDMDESGDIPAEAIQTAWELGGAISSVAEDLGGYGMEDSPTLSSIILEELAYGEMAYAAAVMAPALFISPINDMGTDEQKKKYLPQYCTDNYKAATMALCEPHFGFDAVNLKTTAEKKNGAYVLNGVKCYAPCASKSDHILVAANVDGANNLFVVSSDNPGMTVGEKEKNLGLYSLETNSVTLENCEVPAEDMVGGENGCDYDRMLSRTRTATAALAAGICRCSLDIAKGYAVEREQFGEPIAHRQSIAFMIAEMAYETDAVRLLAWQAASKLEAGKDAKREAFLAKLYAGDMSMKICDYGVQILGGHGYIREMNVERLYRNSRSISCLEAITTL